MAQTHFTNLLIVVVVVGFAAPFALELAPRLRLPAVVLEIVVAVIAFPLTGLSVLRRGAPAGTKPASTRPSPAAAILSADDRALCRTPQTTVEATA